MRSLAGENEEHGGANIAATIFRLEISKRIFERTAGLVRSPLGPCKSSHSRVRKPKARADLATPPQPDKKSAKY